MAIAHVVYNADPQFLYHKELAVVSTVFIALKTPTLRSSAFPSHFLHTNQKWFRIAGAHGPKSRHFFFLAAYVMFGQLR